MHFLRIRDCLGRCFLLNYSCDSYEPYCPTQADDSSDEEEEEEEEEEDADESKEDASESLVSDGDETVNE